MKRIITFILLLIYSFSYGQNHNCNAIVFYKYSKPIIIYDNPCGKAKDSIYNNIKNEDFLYVKILEDSCNYFKVIINHAISNTNNVGWIKKTEYIGTNLKFSRNKDLKLFSKPNENSHINNILHSPILDKFVQILFCSNAWVYIIIYRNGNKYEGWISPDNHCPEQYTTCG